MAETLRAAVVGCGWAGQYHAEAYARHAASTLAAVCDPDRARAEALAEKLGGTAYESLEHMLARERLDVVSVATPTETHVSIGKTCLQAGLPVMCEKPLSRDANSARALVAVAQAAHLPLGVNYNRRFAAGYVRAKNHLASASRIHYINSVLAQNVPLAQTAELRARLPEDFLVFDACSHLLDLACFLVGKPRQLFALATRAVGGQLWTDIAIGLLFEGGAVGNLLVSLAGPEWGQLPIERTEIATERARLVVDNITQAVEWFDYHEDVRHTWRPGIFAPVGYVDSMLASVQAWISAVAEGNPPPVDGTAGLAVVELCEQVVTVLKQ